MYWIVIVQTKTFWSDLRESFFFRPKLHAICGSSGQSCLVNEDLYSAYLLKCDDLSHLTALFKDWNVVNVQRNETEAVDVWNTLNFGKRTFGKVISR